MKALKLLFAVALLTASLEFASTNAVQAKPTSATSAFQIAVRIGERPHRRYYRRPVVVRRPMYNRWHGRPNWHRGPYRRPYRRY